MPILNAPGYLRHQREFTDDSDLNRIFPGRPDGSVAEIYVSRVLERIVRHFEYLIDLHTASFGRVNSLYVRADMHCAVTAKMARLVGPEIIVHNEGRDGTLRSAAEEAGIHAITLEIGDPQLFQQSLIRSSRRGIVAVLDHLQVLDGEGEEARSDPIECTSSSWIYSDMGGVLEVLPKVAQIVEEGQEIARLTNAFGEMVQAYSAPTRGVVIGKSTNPVAQTGARLLHLGTLGALTPLVTH